MKYGGDGSAVSWFRVILISTDCHIFNQNQGTEVDRIYGSVTTGTNWKFLILEGTTLLIDPTEYYINQVDRILGILLQPFSQNVS